MLCSQREVNMRDNIENRINKLITHLFKLNFTRLGNLSGVVSSRNHKIEIKTLTESEIITTFVCFDYTLILCC